MDFELWIVFPNTKRSKTSDVRKRLRMECRNRDWLVQERNSDVRRFNGRPVEVVAGVDADNLYRRAHRVKVAVLFFGRPFVPLNPEARLDRAEHRVALDRFVRYKAHAQRLPEDAVDVSGHLASCEEWRQSVECDSGYDPRCLPLHLFKARQVELESHEDRRRFNEVHGAGARRRDAAGLTWHLNAARFHGREKLHVAGHELGGGVPLGRIRERKCENDNDGCRAMACSRLPQHRTRRSSPRPSTIRVEGAEVIRACT